MKYIYSHVENFCSNVPKFFCRTHPTLVTFYEVIAFSVFLFMQTTWTTWDCVVCPQKKNARLKYIFAYDDLFHVTLSDLVIVTIFSNEITM